MTAAALLTDGVFVGVMLIALATLSRSVALVFLLTLAASWVLCAVGILRDRRTPGGRERRAITERSRSLIETIGLAALLTCAHNLIGRLATVSFISILFCCVFLLRPFQRVMTLFDVVYEIARATDVFVTDENSSLADDACSTQDIKHTDSSQFNIGNPTDGALQNQDCLASSRPA